MRLMVLLSAKITRFLFASIAIICLKPAPPLNGVLEPLLKEFVFPNSNVTFKCKRGFEPSEKFTTVCLENGTWSPSPVNHVCTGDYKPNYSLLVQ